MPEKNIKEKILEEFDSKFLIPDYEDESLGGNYKRVKSFLSQSLEEIHQDLYFIKK